MFGFRNFSVRSAVASPLHLQVGEFVIDAAVDAQGWRQRLADVHIDLAALLLDRRIGDRKVDADLLAILIDREQVDLVVERVVRRLARPLRTRSRASWTLSSSGGRWSRCARRVVCSKPPFTAASSSIRPVTLDVVVDVVPFPPGRQPDELDRAAGERASDVAAQLDDRIAIALDEIVVVLRARRPG